MAAVLPTVSADDNQMDNDILPYYQRRHSETSCPSFGGVTIETNSSSPVPERSEVDLVRALERAVRIETEGGGSPLPTLMHSPFWQEFPDFAFDPTAPLQCEIHRLARQNRWNLATERRYQAKAVMAELSLHYYDSGNLEQWQRLCKEVGITSDFKSITQCKKALKSVYVNIFNLIDHRRNPEIKLIHFKSYGKFVRYTRAGRMFPKEIAKQEGFVKALLRMT